MFTELLAALAISAGARAESITIPRLAAAPHLADFASSGRPSAAQGMAQIDGLVQRAPVDGALVSEPTVVYLGYDAQHLYVVFVCSNPRGAVRAHRVNRDRLPDDDDSVALHLDTFRDRRRLYGFQVNPAGVQVDGIYTEGKGWDLSFDTVWTAETMVQPERYLVLITVPFSSIRFPAAAEHEWGLFVYRGIPRKNEEAFWPTYSTRYQGRLAYAAQLRGLRDLQAGHSAQIVPYGTVRTGRLTQSHPSDRSDTETVSEVRGGVDVKTVLHESLVLDLVANPDFSQVESDEPQTTVNKRFEVFFPEKRPFFIENASYFETGFPVLFTRRIRDPRVGARLTGKLGRYAIGALVSDDVAAAASDGPSSASGSRALNTVFRLSRDLGVESQLGLIYAGRNESRFDNHVGGVDGRWRMNRNWVATGQALVSQRIDSNHAMTGTAVRAGVDGSGHRYTYQFAFVDVAPDFQASAGFIPRTDIRELTQVTSAIFRPAGKRVVAWGPGLTLTQAWDHQRTALDSTARLETRIELVRSSSISVYHALNQERLRVLDAPALAEATRFDQHMTGVTFASAPLPGLAFSGEYSSGTAINLTPAQGKRPMLTGSQTAALTVSVRPTPAFTIDTTYLSTALSDRRSDGAVFSDRIVRSRWNYQLTRRLSARAIARYENLSVQPGRSSLSARRDFNVDLLLTYLVHPGTALYVGGTTDRRRETHDRAEQLFVKVSYLFRL
jgi:hypothetical protein